ncbi:TolC family protein [Chondrinema litorale]|uniref:TolC family protein n=1 Tax=Chondrinema litorale TaxID=2994555 RepID=UPI002542CE5F|nr:TolC family protein [Chondrinema litorale]UZR93868.1 TolC family protein [Chondrinema litorale]
MHRNNYLKGNKLQLKIFMLFILLSSILLSGAKAQEVMKLTFEEAVQRALKENITLKTENNNLLVNQIQKTNAVGQFLPNLSASATLSNVTGNQFIQQQATLVNTSTSSFSPSISSNMLLFGGLRNVNNLKRANSSFDAQQNLIKRTEQDIMYNVSQQFLTVLLDQELVKIAQENIDVQKKQLERIAAFVESGITFKGDQFNLEAQIKSLELAEVQAVNQLENDKSLLAQTLMLDPMTTIEVVTPDQTVESFLVEEFDLNELYTTAMQNRPDFKQFKSLKETGDYAVAVARADYYPTLAAFFDYGSYYNNTAQDAVYDTDGELVGYEKISFQDQIRERNPQTVIGLSLSIPIFSRFNTKTSVVTAKIQRDNAQLNIENLERTIFLDVQTALQNYDAALASYEAASSQFDAAKISMDTQTERYNIGLGNIIDLTTSTNTFVQASVDKANASYTLLFQKIILDYQTGVLNAENISLN